MSPKPKTPAAEDQAVTDSAPSNGSPAVPRPATIDDLKLKKSRREFVDVNVDPDSPDGKVRVTLSSIATSRFDELIAAHRPDKMSRAQGLAFDPMTFPVALIAACMVEPKVTEADVADLVASEGWSKAELQLVFARAYALNIGDGAERPTVVE